MPHQQLEKIYGADQVALTMHLGYAFRACHTHGRALFTLVPRACGPEHEDYFVIDGEMVAGTALGWNFGDGHLHDEQLIDALQKRCHFEPGEVRVVLLEAQPFHKRHPGLPARRRGDRRDRARVRRGQGPGEPPADRP